MDRAEEVARWLAHGRKIVRTGTGWLVQCPAHDDHDPSLHVSPAGKLRDGSVVFHCFGGCSRDRLIPVLRAMGVVESEGEGRRARRPAPAPARARRGNGMVWAGARRAEDAPELGTRKLGEPLAVWTYRNAAGEVVEYVAKYHRPGGKEIRPWSWWRAGAGKPVELAMKAPPQESRLPYAYDRIGAEPGAVVVCCEGEKAADAMQRLAPDVVATCWPGGSSGAGRLAWGVLEGRTVVLVPDEDAQGRKNMADAWAAMARHGVWGQWVELAAICPARLGEEVKGRDAADAEQAGWTAERCARRRARLAAGHPLHTEG